MMMKTNFLTIENRKGKLRLNDGVHKESADKLIEELDRLYGPAAVLAQMKIGDVVCAADDALESVEVEINSPGGSVFEGQRIYTALREMSSRGVAITTTVNGIAASMGSVILMAGDTRQMAKGSRVMIHEASTIAWGDARTMRKNADLLEGISAEIAGIYATRTGGDAQSIRDLMLAETWMDAAKAKELGFIHNVIDYDKNDEESASASIDIRATGQKHAGMSLLNKLFPGKNESEIEALIADSDSLRNDLTAAQGQIESLTADIAAKDQTIAEQVAKIAELTESHEVVSGELATANTALETATAELAEKDKAIAAAKESAGKQAVEALAAIGQPEPLPAGQEEPQASHLETFNSLKGAEATAYFNKFQKEIAAEQRALFKANQSNES